jgi:hypothetical protein
MEPIAENGNKAITFVEAEDRICAECKFLVGTRAYSEAKEWRCHAKQNIVSMDKDVVSGGTIYKLVFATCYDARAGQLVSSGPGEITNIGCGPTGAWFERYTYEGYKQTDYPPRKKGAVVNVDDLLKELE